MMAHPLIEPVQEPGRVRPRLAVLIPVFNEQRGLERSLDSLRQEAAEFEVFVIDDGSNPPIAAPETLPYRVTLIRLPENQGITEALNVGLERIVDDGFEYVGRLDAGDLSLPGRFYAQMMFLDAHPDHAAVGAFVEVVDEQGRRVHVFQPPTDHQDVMRRFCYENALCHPVVMMRVAALRAAGFYVDDYPAGEDYELWLRLARRYKLANLDRVLLRKEKAPGSITGRRLRPALSRLRIQMDHFAPSSVHAYLGVLRSLIALCLSQDVVVWIRRLQSRGQRL
jgi:glycosyltransferase involved in cell wall biosynthesis